MVENNTNDSVRIILDAVPYSKLASHTPIINLNQLNDEIHIHLPEDDCPYIELAKVHTLLPEAKELTEYSECIVRNGKRPWLDIKKEWLDTQCGQHTYKLTFVDSRLGELMHLYFGYIIQEDYPEQSYVYMVRDKE